MGLLDSVLGSVLAGQNNAQGGGLGGLGNVLGSVLGGGQQQQPGQGGGINMGLVAALAPVLMGMLANNSQHGGLGGLLDQFQRSGLGDVASSWVSTGQNLPVSAEQIGQVLGPDVLGQLARSAGMDSGAAGGALAQILPQVIDAMTPDGRLPQQGADLGAMLPQILGGLLGGRR